MEKIDFKKEYKALFKPSAKKVSIVEVPKFNYLMIDGNGSPAAEEYQHAVETLYPMAYTLKFMAKTSLQRDFVVNPLEGLWWAEDYIVFSNGNKDEWIWRSMIMQPDFITESMFDLAREKVTEKNPASLDKIRLDSLDEGLCAQIMHIGPYADEAPTIQKLHQFIEDNGYELRDKHHEIYLSDPRRAKPENMKTVIRQPIRKKA